MFPSQEDAVILADRHLHHWHGVSQSDAWVMNVEQRDAERESNLREIIANLERIAVNIPSVVRHAGNSFATYRESTLDIWHCKTHGFSRGLPPPFNIYDLLS